MDIVFFGSGNFAVRSLESIIGAGHKVLLVVTQPDRPRGRHLDSMPTPLKVKADGLGLTVYQPNNPSAIESIEYLKREAADTFVVASYGHILENAVLTLPRLYCLNLHASLLPKYRGAAPVSWAILNGEKETGISIIRMNKIMDAGDILLQEKTQILDTDDAQSLEDRLAELGAKSIVKALGLIVAGKAEFIKQDNERASFAPKLTRGHGLINWDRSAREIINQIRGLVPWPVAFTSYKNKLLKIWKASIVDKNVGRPGEIVEVNKGSVLVSTSQGLVKMLEVQLASERRLAIEPFLCGHKLNIGDRLG